MKKVCKRCNKLREHSGNGLCKSCYITVWLQNNPEGRIKSNEYKRKSKIKNKKKVREYNKKYRFIHRAEQRKAVMDWREKNKERWLDYTRKWRKSLSGRISQTNDKIRRRTGYKPEDIEQVIMDNFIKNHGVLLCEKCKCFVGDVENAFFEMDHIIPLFIGGDNSYDNFQILCSHCNRTKHLKTMDYRI